MSIQGIQARVNHRTGHVATYLHYTADPRKRSEEWRRAKKRRVKNWLWEREMEISFASRGGQLVFPMMDQRAHVVRDMAGSRCRYFAMDHGRTNPCAALWVRVYPDSDDHIEGDIHAYREYYQGNRTISVNAEAMRRLDVDQRCLVYLCDPTMNTRLQNEESTIKEVYERGFRSLTPADRAEEVGIGRIEDLLLARLARWSIKQDTMHAWFADNGYTWDQVHFWARKPQLTFAPDCINAVMELKQLRRDEPKVSQEDRNKLERVRDYKNHLFDCLKYLVNHGLRWRHVPPPKPMKGTFGERAMALIEKYTPSATSGWVPGNFT